MAYKGDMYDLEFDDDTTVEVVINNFKRISRLRNDDQIIFLAGEHLLMNNKNMSDYKDEIISENNLLTANLIK